MGLVMGLVNTHIHMCAQTHTINMHLYMSPLSLSLSLSLFFFSVSHRLSLSLLSKRKIDRDRGRQRDRDLKFLYHDPQKRMHTPSLSLVQVTCDHTRKILCASLGFPGTVNDKTIARFDTIMYRIRHWNTFTEFTFNLFNGQGEERTETYHRWRTLQCSMNIPSQIVN